MMMKRDRYRDSSRDSSSSRTNKSSSGERRPSSFSSARPVVRLSANEAPLRAAAPPRPLSLRRPERDDFQPRYGTGREDEPYVPQPILSTTSLWDLRRALESEYGPHAAVNTLGKMMFLLAHVHESDLARGGRACFPDPNALSGLLAFYLENPKVLWTAAQLNSPPPTPLGSFPASSSPYPSSAHFSPFQP